MNAPWWKTFDWYLAGSALLLMCFSLVMLLSTSVGTDQLYARNQAIFILIAMAVFWATSQIDLHIMIKASPYIYGAIILLLVAVAVFSQVTRGAASWLDFGFVSLQPSEFMKFGLVLFMAYIFKRYQESGWQTIRLLLAYMAALVLPVGLVLMQPDLGTAMVIVAAWLGVVWMSPLSKKLLATLCVAATATAISGWFTLLAGYQKQRIVTFINPAADPLGHGYNVLQSIIAVGSGGWTGLGWGRGTQSHLNFLPEHHTDFIFASLSEEFGLVGSLFVLVLFSIIFWRMIRLLWRSQSRTHVLVVSGLMIMLVFQAGINMAMNVGLAPITGIPLPLVSYGGSSLLATAITLGIVQSIARAQAEADRQ